MGIDQRIQRLRAASPANALEAAARPAPLVSDHPALRGLEIHGTEARRQAARGGTDDRGQAGRLKAGRGALTPSLRGPCRRRRGIDRGRSRPDRTGLRTSRPADAPVANGQIVAQAIMLARIEGCSDGKEWQAFKGARRLARQGCE
jgi:hypothetical protein